MSLPPSPFLRRILARATGVWAFLHFISAFALAGSGSSPRGALTQGIAAPWIWGATCVVVLVVMQNRGESLLLANLGWSRRGTTGLVVGWCVVMEAALVALAGVVA